MSRCERAQSIESRAMALIPSPSCATRHNGCRKALTIVLCVLSRGSYKLLTWTNLGYERQFYDYKNDLSPSRIAPSNENTSIVQRRHNNEDRGDRRMPNTTALLGQRAAPEARLRRSWHVGGEMQAAEGSLYVSRLRV